MYRGRGTHLTQPTWLVLVWCRTPPLVRTPSALRSFGLGKATLQRSWPPKLSTTVPYFSWYSMVETRKRSPCQLLRCSTSRRHLRRTVTTANSVLLKYFILFDHTSQLLLWLHFGKKLFVCRWMVVFIDTKVVCSWMLFCSESKIRRDCSKRGTQKCLNKK